MKRGLIALGVLVLSTSVFGGSVPMLASPRTNIPDRAAEREPASTVSVYAAVIRRLVTDNHTYGSGGSGFDTVYVIDGAVQAAGDPLRSGQSSRPGRGFGPHIKKELRKALADLPPLTFVKNRNSVITGQPPGRVHGNGVLLTLGPIRGSGTRVEVGNSLWISGLDGQWLTYVLERQRNQWEITGTTGPIAVS